MLNPFRILCMTIIKVTPLKELLNTEEVNSSSEDSDIEMD